MAVLKEAGCRSAANHLSWAKEEHVRITGEWDHQLNEAARLSVRSAERGIGPSHQSAPVDLHRLGDLDQKTGESCPEEPVGALDMVAAGF